MRNKAVKKAILPILGLSLVLGSSLVLATKSKEAEQVSGYSASSLPTTIDLNDTSVANIRSYYSSLNNLSQSERQGTNLLKNLKTILKNGQKYYSYDSGDTVWKMYEITDRDWDKSPASSISGYNSSTNKITGYSYNSTDPYVHALYINRDVTNQTKAWANHNQDQWGINREHVWPKAEGFDTSAAGGARGDPMHLMAGNGYANNIHSNYFYGYVKTSSSYTDCGSKYSNQSGNLRGTSKTLNTGTVFEPQDSDKGDIARATFYMVARYNYLSGSDSDGINSNNPNLTLTQNLSDWASSGYTSTTSNPGKMGIMTDLLAWHHADPVDEYEIHRNNLLYTNFTNNRNPFIDFPEWADFIWGSVNYNGSTYVDNDTTPTGYATPSSDTINGYNSGGSSDPVSVTGVSLNKSSISITIGDSEVLSASISPSNATNQAVSWTSSNSNVASVTNSGRVTAVAEGNATITVTTSDGGYNAACTVTVTASGGGGGDSQSSSETITMSAQGYSNEEVITSISGTGCSISLDKGSNSNSPKYYTTGSAIRTYGGNTFTISSSKKIVRITITFGSGDGSNTITTDVGTYNSGEWTGNANSVTFTVGGTSGHRRISSIEVEYHSESEKTLSSILLDTSDAPTTFNVGDSFSSEGLTVTAYYSDGTDDIVTPTSVSTPNMSTAGQPTVTVTYTEGGVTRTATYTITVNAVTLTSIDVSNEKTEYYVGDTFVKPTVTATFSNGSTSDVTNSATFTGYNLSNAGNQTVTVSYTNGTTETTTYGITVTAVVVTSITISGYETEFTVGDSFSFGGTVTAHYNNGSSNDVTASASFSGYNMSVEGQQTVTVSYAGQTETYTITVAEESDYLTAKFVTQDYAQENSWENSVTYESATVASGLITISSNGTGNNGKYYTSGYEWRFYQFGNGGITISINTDYLIDSIKIKYVIGNTGILLDSSSNQVTSGVSQTVNSTSASYTVGNTTTATNGQAKITEIEIVYHYVAATPLESISASVSKTYTVGERILTSDITVTGNNGQVISGFTFSNNNYQFTYNDAASGGSATSKTFTDSISYSNLTCSLTVIVSRESSSIPVSSTLEHTGFEFSSGGISASSYTTNQTATVDEITFYVDGYIYSNKLSLSNGSKLAPGQVKNTSPYSSAISTVSVSGASPDIQLSTDGSTWVAYNSATPTTVDYYYFRLYYADPSVSSFVNITSITVSLKADENPTNLSNYIMFEDTDNQCTTKFSVAKNRFEQMSTSERNTFMTSDDYVISTARTRLQAWANYLGKTITYSNNDYLISNNNYLSLMLRINGNSAISIIVIVSILGIGTIACYFFIKRRKPE